MSLPAAVPEYLIDGDTPPTGFCAACTGPSSSLAWLLGKRRVWLEAHEWTRPALDVRVGGRRCRFCHFVRSLFPSDLPMDSRITFGGRDDPYSATLPTRRVLREVIVGAATGAGRSHVDRVLGSVGITQSHLAGCASDGGDLHRASVVSQIAEWLSTCRSKHSHGVSEKEKGPTTPIGINLVDVEEFRLVESFSNAEYMALSYVWGNASNFECVLAVKQHLMEPHGLFRYWTRVPRVIRDAIDLVGRLGYRYLWVDSLCITQDDAVQKHNQIAQMHRIYSQAFLTIVAHSAETADSPLPGLGTGTRLQMARMQLQLEDISSYAFDLEKSLFKDGTLEMETLRPNPCTEAVMYEHRGWTLQERGLSRRCLFLDNHNAWFQCSEMCKHDQRGCGSPILSSHEMVRNDMFVDMNNKMANSSISYLRWYAALVEKYQTRLLSFRGDRIRAVEGVLTLLNSYTGGELVGGIPGFGIRDGAIPAQALLWTSKQRDLPVSRSRDKNFPSWSWAGWNDIVCFEVPLQYSSSRFGPVEHVKWSKVEDSTASIRQMPPLTPMVPMLGAQTEAVSTRQFRAARTADIRAYDSGPVQTAWKYLLLGNDEHGIYEAIATWPDINSQEEFELIRVSGAWHVASPSTSMIISNQPLVAAMLVKRLGDYDERVCLALINSVAWTLANPRTRTVRLR